MAENYTLNIDVNTSKAVKSVDKLDDSIKDTSKNTQELESSMSGLDQASGGMITKFKGLKSGLKNVINGFKSMRVAIIATGIGALVLAVSALGAAFTSTEEGQNKFNKIMLVISSVTGNLIDILANLGNAIIYAFTNPLDAIEKFKDFIVENITNRFEAAIDTVGFLGSAIKKVFSGDFTGAMEDAKSAGNSYIDSLTGVKNTLDKVTESVKELSNELIEEAKIAAGIADQRAKADKLERQLLVDRATANRDRAKLLEQAVDRENFSTKQRIEFLEEAGRLEEEITNKEIIAAKLRYDAKVAENALAGSTKADLEEQAQLEANLINLETAKLTKAKEVTSQTIALRNEEAAALKAIKDQEKADKEADDIVDKERTDKIAADKKIADEKEIADAKTVADAKKAIRNAELDNIANGVNVLAKLAPKSKALQAAGIIASNAVGIAKIIQNTTAANAAARLKYALIPGGTALATAEIAANKVSAGINIATSLAATAQGLSALKAGGSAGGSISLPNDSSSGAQEPQFNIVGQGGANQIASALGQQQQQPIQAYVVSQDVTTAQSLENGIIQGATLGG